MKRRNQPVSGKGRGTKPRPRTRWASFKPGLPLILGTKGFSPGVEQYRNLALKVEERFGERKGQGYVVTVTSPDAGAGKSITSLNLALSLARRGERRVLVVEGDLWKPEYEQMLKLTGSSPGLVQLLSPNNQLQLTEATFSIWSAGLDLLASGGSSEDGDLITSRRMIDLVEELRSAYDVVIMDSPPYPLASGHALASLADGAIIVVRAGHTKKRGIEDILSTLGPEKVLGLVLNRTRQLSGSYSKYPAYSGYSKRYPGYPPAGEDRTWLSRMKRKGR